MSKSRFFTRCHNPKRKVSSLLEEVKKIKDWINSPHEIEIEVFHKHKTNSCRTKVTTHIVTLKYEKKRILHLKLRKVCFHRKSICRKGKLCFSNRRAR